MPFQLMYRIPEVVLRNDPRWKVSQFPLSDTFATKNAVKRERTRRLQAHAFNPDHLVIIKVTE